jgi:hypothetical protein
MQLRNFLARAFAILLIGSLTCSPFAVSSASADPVAHAHAMSSDMVMDATAAAVDEMPCHKDNSDKGKSCPFIALCMMSCCQGIMVSQVPLAVPAGHASRMVPVALVQFDGISSRPPSRPPKA